MTSYADTVVQALAVGSAAGAKAAGNITTDVSKSIPKVASSIFESGPKDALVAVDSYGKRAVSFINQEAAGVKGKFDGFFSNIRILSTAKDTLKSAAQTATSALKAVNDAKSQLENYTGLNLSSLGAAKASLNNAAITTLANVSGYDVNRVMRDGEAIQRIASNADLGSVNGLYTAANRLLGVGSVGNLVDMRSDGSVLGALMSQAGQLGMTDLFDKLWDKVSADDNLYGGSTARYSANQTVASVLQNGDLVMLNKLIDKLGGSAILQQYPDAFSRFLNNYRIDYDSTPADYDTIRNSITTTFNRIDPNWMTLAANGVTEYQLAPFANATNIVMAIFGFRKGADVRAATSALIASSYPKQSASSLFRAYYPNMPL
ncbi:hypothetical protein pEaSNUABM54_00079 [Erwinia phage pEa_SNUABM_54]|nr:hypothetical protein pEaSNUABM54_00079 [Erwinia phage pEa_SNUABM_54]